MQGHVQQTLIAELRKEDQQIEQARRQFDEAQARYQLITRRYAAVRDTVADYLMESPYKGKEAASKYASLGRFRFIHMNPSDAAIEVLGEATKPLTLPQIINTLRKGALYIADVRTVSAALQNNSRVEKVGDEYAIKEVSPEEIPFE